MSLLLAACNSTSIFPSSRSEPPVASIVATPNWGEAPLTVNVDTSGSYDPDGRIELRSLSVNGGPRESIGEHHTLIIEAPGSYQLEILLVDDTGEENTARTTVTAHDGSGQSAFRIDVRHSSGAIGMREREIFDRAAKRWSEVIVGDLPDRTVQAYQVQSACNGYSYSGVIDDLLLFGDVDEIDGPGGIVGMAGACLLRPDGFPLVGLIILDSADVDFMAAAGELEAVVLHELGHVLDISMSGWNRRGLLTHDQPSCFDSSTVEFTGAGAIEEYRRLGGNGRVPVENNGVGGTACSHWDEETFRSELMTGYLDSDSRLSRLTVAALGDMGYAVDIDAVDEYSLPSSGAVKPLSSGRKIGERVLPAGGILGEDGELIPLPGQGSGHEPGHVH